MGQAGIKELRRELSGIREDARQQQRGESGVVCAVTRSRVGSELFESSSVPSGESPA